MGFPGRPVPLLGGRSNHVWLLHGAENMVLKLYNTKSCNPLFANDPDREVASLNSLAGTGMVPRLIDAGSYGEHRWLLYAHVTGSTWHSEPAHVARLLGRLHDQPVPAHFPRGTDGSRSITLQAERILARCRLETKSGRAVADLRPTGHVEPSGTELFVHGDPVPGNLIEHDGTLTLIDWQCPVRGDPAEDLAVFSSPAMQILYRGRVLTPVEEAEFLDAYPDPGTVQRFHRLRPWYHWRMAAYCLWKVQNGFAEYQEALHLERQALSGPGGQ